VSEAGNASEAGIWSRSMAKIVLNPGFIATWTMKLSRGRNDGGQSWEPLVS
jgi:hypothetical protein